MWRGTLRASPNPNFISCYFVNTKKTISFLDKKRIGFKKIFMCIYMFFTNLVQDRIFLTFLRSENHKTDKAYFHWNLKINFFYNHYTRGTQNPKSNAGALINKKSFVDFII